MLCCWFKASALRFRQLEISFHCSREEQVSNHRRPPRAGANILNFEWSAEMSNALVLGTNLLRTVTTQSYLNDFQMWKTWFQYGIVLMFLFAGGAVWMLRCTKVGTFQAFLPSSTVEKRSWIAWCIKLKGKVLKYPEGLSGFFRICLFFSKRRLVWLIKP